MRHARSDYNHIQDPSGRILEDEPVFIVRGQDKAAKATLLAWASEAARLGASPEMVARVREWAEVMEAWGTKKVPDAPEEALR